MSVLALLLSTALVSQTAAPTAPTGEGEDVASGLQAEGVRKAKYNDIERGFGLRMPVGMLAFITPVTNTAGGFNKRYTAGMLIGLELAYDIAPSFDLGGFFYYAQNGGVDGAPRRDLVTLFGGLVARFSFFHTERFFLGVRAGAGYGLQDNKVERAQQGLGIIAGLTAEYFTRIRHFSLALDVGALAWITTAGSAPVAIGITAIPSIKYTF